MALSERKHHHEDLTLIRSKTCIMNGRQRGTAQRGPVPQRRGSTRVGAIKGNNAEEERKTDRGQGRARVGGEGLGEEALLAPGR